MQVLINENKKDDKIHLTDEQVLRSFCAFHNSYFPYLPKIDADKAIERHKKNKNKAE